MFREHRWIQSVLALVILSLACAPLDILGDTLSPAGMWYVAVDGSDSNDCLSPDTACRTIGAAVDKAEKGGQIQILPGTHQIRSAHIDKSLRIIGSGIESTTLEGSELAPALITGWQNPIGDNLSPSTEIDVLISDLTINKAREGAIYNSSMLTVVNVNLRENVGARATGLINKGGGFARLTNVRIVENESLHKDNCHIHNEGNLELRDVEIRSNISGRAGLCNFSDTETSIYSTTIAENGSRGILNGDGSHMELSNVTIRDNHVALDGAGLRNLGTLLIHASTLDGNRIEGPYPRAGAGIHNSGSLTLESSTISNNGGGLYNGIYNAEESTIVIINSTISSNQQGPNGIGGVYTEGALELRYSTLAFNSGVGLARLVDAPDPVVVNSIIAENDKNCQLILNVAGEGEAVIDRITLSRGKNLDSDKTCFLTGDHLTGVDPRLKPLTDNGGSTMTHALQADSPVVDKAQGDCPAADQRGESRPSGTACDIGAYERDISDDAARTSGELPQGNPTGNTTCRSGPGVIYPPLTYLVKDQTVVLTAQDRDGSWLKVDSLNGDFSPCWVNGDLLQVDPDFSLDMLPFGPIPPTPTSTHPPEREPEGNQAPQGCLYQPPNENQPQCYPIDQCPVPFDESLGECNP